MSPRCEKALPFATQQRHFGFFKVHQSLFLTAEAQQRHGDQQFAGIGVISFFLIGRLSIDDLLIFLPFSGVRGASAGTTWPTS